MADTFRRFGTEKQHASAHIWNVARTSATRASGLPKSRQLHDCHKDMNGQSLMHVGAVYFQSGETLTTANTSAEAGENASVAAGTTSTIDGGSNVEVTNVGNSCAAVYDFAIPDAFAPVSISSVSAGTNCSVTDANGAYTFVFADGQTGDQGANASVSVGSVTTTAAGLTPTVTNAGNSCTAVYNFNIPSASASASSIGSVLAGSACSVISANGTYTFVFADGQTGDQGTNASVSVGSVTTTAAGLAPTVTNAGNSCAAVYNFGIPFGASPTVSVGTVSTLSANQTSSVANVGTSPNGVYDFAFACGSNGGEGSGYWTQNSDGTLATSAVTAINSTLGFGTGSVATANLSQGGYILWNATGYGETDVVNNRGFGNGGVYFVDNYEGTNTVTSTIIPSSGLYATDGIQPRWQSGWFPVSGTVQSIPSVTLTLPNGTIYNADIGGYIVSTNIAWTTTTLPRFRVFFTNTTAVTLPVATGYVLADVSAQCSISANGLEGGFLTNYITNYQFTMQVAPTIAVSIPSGGTAQTYTSGYFNVCLY